MGGALESSNVDMATELTGLIVLQSAYQAEFQSGDHGERDVPGDHPTDRIGATRIMTAMEEIAAFADVPVDIEAELDRRILNVGQILQMEPGSLIGMKRSAGENIDLYVGGTLIGCGEIVVVENTLGVRITDFIGDV